MQQTQCGVTLSDAAHNQPKPVNVRNLRKAQMLRIHFFINRKQGFFAAAHANIKLRGVKHGLHFFLDFFNQIAAAATGFGNSLRQHLIAPRLQMPEGQVLQLPKGLVQT